MGGEAPLVIRRLLVCSLLSGVLMAVAPAWADGPIGALTQPPCDSIDVTIFDEHVTGADCDDAAGDARAVARSTIGVACGEVPEDPLVFAGCDDARPFLDEHVRRFRAAAAALLCGSHAPFFDVHCAELARDVGFVMSFVPVVMDELRSNMLEACGALPAGLPAGVRCA